MNAFRALRYSLCMTQAELAAKLGVNRMSIYNYEKNICHPSFAVLKKLVQIGREQGVEIDIGKLFAD